MKDNFDLERREDFRINPQVWLQTLLAIAGDQEEKAKAVQRVAQETGWPPEKVEDLFATTIKVLLDQTRSN